MSLIPKINAIAESGITMHLRNNINLFIFNNLAERVGFESVTKRSFKNI